MELGGREREREKERCISQVQETDRVGTGRHQGGREGAEGGRD